MTDFRFLQRDISTEIKPMAINESNVKRYKTTLWWFYECLKWSRLGNTTLTTFYRLLWLYLVPSMANIFWRHQLFQSSILSQDVLPLLRPVKHCKGVSIALAALSKLLLKVAGKVD